MINKYSLLFIFTFMIVVSRILKFVILSFWIVLNFRGFFYEDCRSSSLGSVWSVVSYYRVVFVVHFMSIVQFDF